MCLLFDSKARRVWQMKESFYHAIWKKKTVDIKYCRNEKIIFQRSIKIFLLCFWFCFVGRFCCYRIGMWYRQLSRDTYNQNNDNKQRIKMQIEIWIGVQFLMFTYVWVRVCRLLIAFAVHKYKRKSSYFRRWKRECMYM